MAMKISNLSKFVLSSVRANRPTFSTATTQKMKDYAPTVDSAAAYLEETKQPTKKPQKGDLVPVYVAIGMILLSTTFGLHTAWHQLRHAPNVNVKKSRRETLPELEDPNRVFDEAEKFIKKSFFRKVAHVQESDHVWDPIRGDVLARQPRAETVMEVGVEPKQH